jgi:CDGSH-type Zn-finger protein
MAAERRPEDERPDPATITPYRNGPYLLRGDFTILDQDGNPIERVRETVALCRCGRSQSKPFCDGTHKVVGFEAESAPDPPRPLDLSSD